MLNLYLQQTNRTGNFRNYKIAKESQVGGIVIQSDKTEPESKKSPGCNKC